MALSLRTLAIVIMVSALGSLIIKRDLTMAIAQIAIAMCALNSARIYELEDKLNEGKPPT